MLSIAVTLTLAAAPGAPLLLRPEPLPTRPTGIEQVDGPEWRVLFGHWSEHGGARFSALRLQNRWVVAPLGDAYAWKEWIVIEGLVPTTRVNDPDPGTLPPGATIGVRLGTDDFFARRVVLVHRQTGARVDAPWDTLAPLPLGKHRWLLVRCRLESADDTLSAWAVVWNSASGSQRELGRLAAAPCHQRRADLGPWGRQDPLVVPAADGAWVQLSADGGTHWVKLDAAGRGTPSAAPALTDAGTPLRAFELARPAVFSAAVTSDGRPLLAAFADGGTAPLQPGLSEPFVVYGGFLFADDGVFKLPRGVTLDAGR